MAALTSTNTLKTTKNFKVMTKNSVETINNSEKSYSFSLIDAIITVLSLLAIVIDSFTDILLVIEYIHYGFTVWAIITLVLIIFPSFVVQMFSLRWHISDGSCTKLHWILHLFSLGILHRYFCAMQLGLEARKTQEASDYNRLYAAESDLSLLHLFESFLESAPQLVVQLFVVASLQEIRFFTGLSVMASIFSLALSLVAYSRAQRRIRTNKACPGWPGLFLQALWRLGTLTARVCALVILLLALQAWFLLFIGLHWICMFVWILYQKTDLCDKKWEERCYNAVAAVIYCFCFFNLKEGRSRWRLMSFYVLIVLQNLISLTMFLMFYNEKVTQLRIMAFVAILGGTVVGTLSIIIYYRFFHPSGPKFLCNESSTTPEPQHINDGTLRSLKRPYSEAAMDYHENAKNNLAASSPGICDSKLALSDSIVIIEESDMEEIRTLQEWMKEASNERLVKHRGTCSPIPEADEVASSVLSAHDYENLAAINIAREGMIRSWRGYCDIDTWAHDDSVGRDEHTQASSTTTTTSQDYLDSIAEDYADCKTTSSLHTIVEECEGNCPVTSLRKAGSCALVATIDQIRIETPVQDERNSRVRRTFSLLRERFESREPPPPTAPWATRDCPTPSSRHVSVREMRDFFIRQVLTPSKLNALRKKAVVSPMP